ncbi:MAG: hypothetical protein PHG69_06705, partial [Candidatus Omnitrophica bacterium]|nr:hypothetical protein [Candidatus Omnitrophota bacterium]
LLFSSLLEFWASNSVSINIMAFIRIIIGIVWIMSGIAILCKLTMYSYKKTASFIKIKLSQNKIVKKIANLSYEEKLLLYLAVRLDIPIVPVSKHNRIALILATKRILREPNPFLSFSSLDAESFRIPADIWELLISRKIDIFKEFLGKTDEDLKKEYENLL